MIQRFKDKDFNKAYNLWISRSPEEVKQLMSSTSGSNRDDAFKRGYKKYRCVYQRNWILYPIYIAGKEWKNKNTLITILIPLLIACLFSCTNGHKPQRDYQIEVSNDSTEIWDGARLIGKIPYDSTSKFDSLITKDNE